MEVPKKIVQDENIRNMYAAFKDYITDIKGLHFTVRTVDLAVAFAYLLFYFHAKLQYPDPLSTKLRFQK